MERAQHNTSLHGGTEYDGAASRFDDASFFVGRIPSGAFPLLTRDLHSDQGTEFMAQRCTAYLEGRGVQISVSDVVSPWQKGYVESFFGRFKHELGDVNRFESAGEMIEAICRHIHTALNMPPAVYKAQTFSDTCLHGLGI